MASAKLTDDELISRVNSEIADSIGYNDTVSDQREKAMEYYYGLPLGN